MLLIMYNPHNKITYPINQAGTMIDDLLSLFQLISLTNSNYNYTGHYSCLGLKLDVITILNAHVICTCLHNGIIYRCL